MTKYFAILRYKGLDYLGETTMIEHHDKPMIYFECNIKGISGWYDYHLIEVY